MTGNEPELDRKAYGRLLQRTYPGVIKNDAENERLLVIIEGLMAKGDGKVSPEEDALLELLLRLVPSYERERYPIPPSPPRTRSDLPGSRSGGGAGRLAGNKAAMFDWAKLEWTWSTLVLTF